MKKPWNKALAALTAAAFAMLAAPTSAQVSTTANGPYYATPSWDQKLTTNRFVILANWNSEAVLDRETGLVWERTPSTAFFIGAVPAGGFGTPTHIDRCVNLTLSGRRGWRVPSVQELASLIDGTTNNPALPAGHPFVPNLSSTSGSDANVFWTSTAYISGLSIQALRTVNPWSGSGGVAGSGGGVITLRVWCVRGGTGVPDQ